MLKDALPGRCWVCAFGGLSLVPPTPQTRLPDDPMPCAPGLLAPLLGLALGLTLSLPTAGAAADCGSLDPAERLAFSSVARARWLAPRIRAPGPLDVLYRSARGFLDLVQRNPFPAGESPLPGALAGGGPGSP